MEKRNFYQFGYPGKESFNDYFTEFFRLGLVKVEEYDGIGTLWAEYTSMNMYNVSYNEHRRTVKLIPDMENVEEMKTILNMDNATWEADC